MEPPGVWAVRFEADLFLAQQGCCCQLWPSWQISAQTSSFVLSPAPSVSSSCHTNVFGVVYRAPLRPKQWLWWPKVALRQGTVSFGTLCQSRGWKCLNCEDVWLLSGGKNKTLRACHRSTQTDEFTGAACTAILNLMSWLHSKSIHPNVSLSCILKNVHQAGLCLLFPLRAGVVWAGGDWTRSYWMKEKIWPIIAPKI